MRALALLVASAVACRGGEQIPTTGSQTDHEAAPPTTESPHERELAALRAFEDDRRSTIDFAALPPAEVVLGPDPYRIARLRDDVLIGILTGASAVVALDGEGAERSRALAPASPRGLAVSNDGDVLVVGEGARELAHYRADGGRLERVATLEIDALGLRDVALSPDGATAYVVEERDGRLLAIGLARTRERAFRATGVRELGRCHGPIDVEAIAGYVVVNCLLDHAIELRRDDGEVVRIRHDGPLWSFALHREHDGGVLVAAGGIEDHPLEREDGGFGYIDSYLYLYRVAPRAAQPTRLAAINTSELGVVTPKWIAIRAVEHTIAVSVAGYASAHLLTLSWRDGDLAAAPRIADAELPPGTTAAHLADDGTLIAANPLLDAWIVQHHRAPPRKVAIPHAQPPRALPSRIGELLLFTTMMAPWNSTEDKHSRFTCEACHYEGYVDGRTHYTGRGQVHATTRPLYGLFNNRPHFSRALDKTTTKMVHAEFRVANRFNGHDPWFALTIADVPWLAYVDGMPARLAPEFLREAAMTFLADFTHRANPAAAGRTRFTQLERAGAAAFRDRCASCHAPRLVTDNAGSVVPFERWESLVLSPVGPIVWGQDTYEMTGVVPYVHDRGARVPSLRRLTKKWPYFTNGSAHSLADVLDRFAWDARAYHDGAPPSSARLGADDKAALSAFLALL
jgi:cytochrome c553